MNTPKNIKELHSGYKEGKFSVDEVVENYLARIKAFDKDLNAFITVTDDYARERAKKLQEALKDDKKVLNKMPLFGVPIAVKDMYLTKGIRTTAASNVLKDYVPAYSSTVFERLEGAGAILVGKTNCDAWAHGASGENSDFGPTKNPWNETRVPGGSSSGSAVSVAADMSLVAMGTDTGGSIRQPASFCGIYGFKPTYGAVSRYGVVAMASSLDSMGHMARNVDDVERVFMVTGGGDGKDATVKDFDYKKPAFDGKPRIGIPKEYFEEGLDPEVKEKVMAGVKVLENAGCEVAEVSLPHTKYGISVYYIVQPAEVSSNLGRYDGIRYGNGRDSFGAEAKRRIMLGTYVLSSGYYDAYYNKAMKVRTLIRKDFEEVFKKVDALVAPVSPTTAFKLGERSHDPLSMYLADIYTVSANLAGTPGLSVPAGVSSDGLPIGMQILGDRFSESKIFHIAKMFEEKTDYHNMTPKL